MPTSPQLRLSSVSPDPQRPSPQDSGGPMMKVASGNETLFGSTRSRIVGFAREASNELRTHLSSDARDALSVGNFRDAVDTAFNDGDVITWAAAMCLGGYPSRARQTLESLVIAAVSRCQSTAPQSPLAASAGEGESPTKRSRAAGVLYSEVNNLVDRVQVTRWYLACAYLDPAFQLPEDDIVRQYFRFAHPKASMELAAAATDAERRRLAVSLLRRQLSATQNTFVRLLVFWQQCRLSSALSLCNTYLSFGGDTADPDDILVRFVRCHCNMRLGNAGQSLDDALALLRSRSRLVRAVASTIRAPLSQRSELLKDAHVLGPSQCRHAYFISFHFAMLAYTLRGNFEKCLETADLIEPHVPAFAFWSRLHHDTTLTALIATRDTKPLRIAMCSRAGQAHVWVSRYYGIDVVARLDDVLRLCLFSAPVEHTLAGHPGEKQRSDFLKRAMERASNEDSLLFSAREDKLHDELSGNKANVKLEKKESSRPSSTNSSPNHHGLGDKKTSRMRRGSMRGSTNGTGDSPTAGAGMKRRKSLEDIAYDREELDEAEGEDTAPCDEDFSDVRLAIVARYSLAMYMADKGYIYGAWRELDGAAVLCEEIVTSAELCCSVCSPLRIFTATVSVGLLCVTNDIAEPANVLRRVKEVYGLLRHHFPDHALALSAQASIFLNQGDAAEACSVAKKLAARSADGIYGQVLYAMAQHRCENHAIASLTARQIVGAYPHDVLCRDVYRAVNDGAEHEQTYYYRGCLPIALVCSLSKYHVLRSAVIGLLLTLHVLITLALTVLGATYAYFDEVVVMPAGTAPDVEKYLKTFTWTTSDNLPEVLVIGFAVLHLIFFALPSIAATNGHDGIMLHKLRFFNTAGNRAVWSLRVCVWANLVSAILFAFGKEWNALEDSPQYATFALLGALGASCLPFTTRFLAMRSMDEPSMWFPRWTAVLLFDLLLFPFVAVPHLLVIVLGPFAAIAQAFFGRSDAPGVPTALTKAYTAMVRLLLAKTQPAGPTRFAGFEEDLALDLDVFPLIKSGNAGTVSAAFSLTVSDEADILMRKADRGQRAEKNARALKDIKQRRASLIKARGALAGQNAAFAGSESQMMSEPDDGAAGDALQLMVTQPTNLASDIMEGGDGNNDDDDAVDLVRRRAPHAKDPRSPMVEEVSAAGTAQVWVCLYDSADTDAALQLGVPETNLSGDRTSSVDRMSSCVLRDVIVRAQGLPGYLVPPDEGSTAVGSLAKLPAICFALKIPELASPEGGRQPARSLSRTSSSRGSFRGNTTGSVRLGRSTGQDGDRLRVGNATPMDGRLSGRSSRASSRESLRSNPLDTRDVTPAAAGSGAAGATPSSGTVSSLQSSLGTARGRDAVTMSDVDDAPFTTKKSNLPPRSRSTSQKGRAPAGPPARANSGAELQRAPSGTRSPAVNFLSAVAGMNSVPSVDSEGDTGSDIGSATASGRGSLRRSPMTESPANSSLKLNRTLSGTKSIYKTDNSIANSFLDQQQFVLPLPAAHEPVTDRTAEVKPHFDTISRLTATLEQKVQKATSDRDIAQVEELQRGLTKAKHGFAADLTMMGKNLTLTGKIIADTLLNLIQHLLKEPESNNFSLLSMVLGKFGKAMALGKNAYRSGWMHTCVRLGKPRFLVLLMQLPNALDEIDSKRLSELLVTAAKHEVERTQLISAVLRFHEPLKLGRMRIDLDVLWTNAAETLGTKRRLFSKEDTAGRAGLVHFMCTNPDVIKPPHAKLNKKDGMTMFMRACRDGDEEIVRMFLTHGLVTQPNEVAVGKERLTPLGFATLHGQKDIVELLLSCAAVDPLFEMDGKNAYTIAQEHHKHALIIAALRRATNEARSRWEAGQVTNTTGNAMGPSPSSVTGSFTGGGAPAGAQRRQSLRRGSILASVSPQSSELTPGAGGPMAGAVPALDVTDSDAAASLAAVNVVTPKISTPANAASPATAQQRVSATDMEGLFAQVDDQLRRAAASSHSTGEDIAAMRQRQELATVLNNQAGHVMLSPRCAEHVTSVIDRLITDGSARDPSVVDLLRAICVNVPGASYDVGFHSLENDWLVALAKQGRVPSFDVLINACASGDSSTTELPAVHCRDVIGATSKSEQRLGLVRALLRASRSWRRHRVELAPLWQTYFENIAYATESFAAEDATERFSVLEMMLKHRDIEIDFVGEADDGHNVFSRACAYGDIDFVQFALERRVVPDPSAPLSDGTTPLVQAVCQNHEAVVGELLKHPGVRVDADVAGQGNALQIAERLHRKPRIIDLLRAALGMSSAHRQPSGRRPSMRRPSIGR